MMIRKECLGIGYNKTTKNGCNFKGVITDDPENFALYKVLELDVFERNLPPVVSVEVSEDKPKKKKKRDTSEGNE